MTESTSKRIDYYRNTRLCYYLKKPHFHLLKSNLKLSSGEMLVSNNHKNHPCGIQKNDLPSHRRVTWDSVSHPTNTVPLVARGSQVPITQTHTPRISDRVLGRGRETQLLFEGSAPPYWVCFSADLLSFSREVRNTGRRETNRVEDGDWSRRERLGKVLGSEMPHYATPRADISQ